MIYIIGMRRIAYIALSIFIVTVLAAAFNLAIQKRSDVTAAHTDELKKAATGKAPYDEKIFGAESFTLPNGMKAVVIPAHRAPVVTHMVWYKVGAADEPRGKSGIAHFVEHLMFKGTDAYPVGEFSRIVRQLGGNHNAMTGQDFTAYHQSVAKEHLETMMRLEADRMRGLIFPPDDVDSERLVVIEERRQVTENDPRGYFFEQMNAALFVNHPYQHPTIGWLHEVEALSRDDAIAFYNTHYAPNNAILVVAGDITAEELYPMAMAIYGDIPARAVPERNWTAVPPLLGTQRLVLHHDSIRQPLVRRAYRVPSARQDKDDSLALTVLASILGDGMNARFYRSLVIEQRLASSAGFGYGGTAWDDGRVVMSATPLEGISPEAVEAAMEEELRSLIRDGITDEELQSARTRLIDAAIFSRDSLTGPAMIFGYTLVTGGTIDDVEYWQRDIAGVTASQIHDVAARYLDPDNMKRRPYVTGYLLPANQSGAQDTPPPAPAPEEQAE